MVFTKTLIKNHSIVFFGSDQFSIIMLNKIWKLETSRLCAVVSAAKPHSSIVSFYCEGKDFGIVASFGKRIPSKILRTFKRGCINVHPSLIPKFRGASPLYHTVLKNEKESGVTFLLIEPNDSSKIDSGRILKQVRFRINENSSVEELRDLTGQIAGQEVSFLTLLLKNNLLFKD
ncbi:hypothetical protein ACOME3_004203 [Neoechinorhynchus agilis]